jgi:DNA-binding MarR family transcriptional regulator
VTELISELFRLNSRMLTAGDRLAAELGLTSARRQVLGCVAAARAPQPAPWFARDMGANRQNIQRIVKDLEREGLVAFRENPHHRRAQLVILTVKRRETFAAAMAPAGAMGEQGLGRVAAGRGRGSLED